MHNYGFFFQATGEGKERNKKKAWEEDHLCLDTVVGQPGKVGLSFSLKFFSPRVFFRVKGLSISLGELN